MSGFYLYRPWTPLCIGVRRLSWTFCRSATFLLVGLFSPLAAHDTRSAFLSVSNTASEISRQDLSIDVRLLWQRCDLHRDLVAEGECIGYWPQQATAPQSKSEPFTIVAIHTVLASFIQPHNLSPPNFRPPVAWSDECDVWDRCVQSTKDELRVTVAHSGFQHSYQRVRQIHSEAK